MPRLTVFDDLKIYAFVGPAGTGKSQRAQLVADRLDAEFIIDDGLVIRRTTIVAGKSAKTEKNQIRAIRRAMFEYDDHRRAVQEFFEGFPFASVMIIATSVGMVDKIVDKLGFPPPIRTVYIDDVATPEEMARAKRQRRTKGQHVIPVSHVLVRKNFAGKMVGSLRVLWKGRSPHDGEKTIVRPPFSFYGEVHIENEAIEALARYVALRSPQVSAVVSLHATSDDGDSLRIAVDLRATLGALSMMKLSNIMRASIARSVSYFSGIEVKSVSVNIVGIDFEANRRKSDNGMEGR